HFFQQNLDSLAGAVTLSRNLLARGHNCLSLAELDHHSAIISALDDATEDLALLIVIFAVNGFALEVANFPVYHLLHRLGGDTSKVLWCADDLDDFTQDWRVRIFLR